MPDLSTSFRNELSALYKTRNSLILSVRAYSHERSIILETLKSLNLKLHDSQNSLTSTETRIFELEGKVKKLSKSSSKSQKVKPLSIQQLNRAIKEMSEEDRKALVSKILSKKSNDDSSSLPEQDFYPSVPKLKDLRS